MKKSENRNKDWLEGWVNRWIEFSKNVEGDGGDVVCDEDVHRSTL